MAPIDEAPMVQELLQDGRLLELYVGNEERLLDAIRRDGGSWIARLRQARRVDRALEALNWSETRLMGEDAFIRNHGLLRSGVWMGGSAAVAWFLLMGVGGARELFVGLLVGAVFGVVTGFLSGMFEWDRAESRFARTLKNVESARGNLSTR